MTRKEQINKEAKWNETCRKVALEVFGKKFKYLSNKEEQKVKAIARNRINA